jgi:hypothetical protein
MQSVGIGEPEGKRELRRLRPRWKRHIGLNGLKYMCDFFLGYFTPDDGSDRLSRKSVNNYKFTPHNIPEDGRSWSCRVQ